MRVRCCRLQGISPEQTAQLLGCTLGLVQEYLRIDDELKTRSPKPKPKSKEKPA